MSGKVSWKILENANEIHFLGAFQVAYLKLRNRVYLKLQATSQITQEQTRLSVCAGSSHRAILTSQSKPDCAW